MYKYPSELGSKWLSWSEMSMQERASALKRGFNVLDEIDLTDQPAISAFSGIKEEKLDSGSSAGQHVHDAEAANNQGKRARLDQKPEEVNIKLMSLVQCGVCLDVMTPPCKICVNGHPLCSTCRSQVKSCPFCSGSLSEVHNLALEGIMEMIKYPCVHENCNEQHLLQDKTQHEARCVHRPSSCLVKTCEWKGMKVALPDHLKEIHTYKYHSRDFIWVVPFSLLDKSYKTNVFLHQYDEVFKIHFVCQPDSLFQAMAILNGDDQLEKAKNFIFQIKISKEKENPEELMLFKREVLSDRLSPTAYAKRQAGFSVPVDYLRKFASHDSRFFMSVSIEPRRLKQVEVAATTQAGANHPPLKLNQRALMQINCNGKELQGNTAITISKKNK